MVCLFGLRHGTLLLKDLVVLSVLNNLPRMLIYKGGSTLLLKDLVVCLFVTIMRGVKEAKLDILKMSMTHELAHET